MDPVTIAILAAIAAGVTTGATKVGEDIISDTYQGLKSLILRKFGAESKIATAIGELEKKPNSAGRKMTLEEEITTIKADQDPEIVKAAALLVKQIEAHPNGKQIVVSVSGNKAIGIGGNVSNSTFIIGDHNKKTDR